MPIFLAPFRLRKRCFLKGRTGTVLAFMMAVTTLSLPSMIMLRKAVKPRLLAVFIAICNGRDYCCRIFVQCVSCDDDSLIITGISGIPGIPGIDARPEKQFSIPHRKTDIAAGKVHPVPL